MPSKLGAQIRAARLKKGIKLRELARAIGKSPAFITRLECDEEFPAALPDTLKAIAALLDLESDAVLIAAGRTSEMAPPKNTIEVALYRKVQAMSRKDQQELLKHLEEKRRKSQ
jgi:transcriptional regulator with XRE-family HTH domain